MKKEKNIEVGVVPEKKKGANFKVINKQQTVCLPYGSL